MSDSPAVILYDQNGNPIALSETGSISVNQKGILVAGRDEDGNVKFISVFKDTGAISVVPGTTKSSLGDFFCGTDFITGSVSSQNLLTLANPSGSNVDIRVKRVVINGIVTAASTVPFLYKISRSSNFPVSGTLVQTQKRRTLSSSSIAQVRQVPVVTKASGSMWSTSPGIVAAVGSSQVSPGAHEPLVVNLEHDEIVLTSEEAIVISAGANTADWSHWVNLYWSEVES